MRRHRSSISTLALRALFIVAALAGFAPLAEAQLVIYDDFTAPLLDGVRWSGRQLNTNEGGNGSSLEIERSVANGRLVMRARVAGGPEPDTGQRSSETALMFRHPGALNEIVFNATVKELQIAGCASGSASAAGVRGVYAFFNDGLGDIVATIELRRSSDADTAATMLEVVGTLTHRTDAGDETLLGWVPLGTAAIGQKVRLRVKWDRDDSTVKFQKDLDAVAPIAYSNPVVADAGAPRKYLGAIATSGDCRAASSTIVGLFNTVRVNQ